MLSRSGRPYPADDILEYQTSMTDSARRPLSRRAVIKTLLILTCLATAAGYWVWSRMLAQNQSRIEREHGLVLPASAANFACGGDGWSVLDRAAVATFDIAAADLPAFMKQLKPDSRFTPPWGTPDAYGFTEYYCKSPTGDGLLVRTKPVANSRVLITLGTDWN
jgi:hypothetical protein